MAQMDSSHSETVSRHSRAQNWSPSNSFDLWLSKDTKNSTLWTVVLTMLAVKRQRRKMKFYMQKSQNLKYLDTLELYTSKKSLQHVQCKFKKEKYDYLKKRIIFWKLLIFFPKGGPFDVKIVKNFFFRFSKILKTDPKNDFHGTIQT